MAKKMIIKGVGTFMAKRMPTDPNGPVEIVTLGTLQNLKIDLNVDIEDIFGGDSMFAIDTLVKSKSIEVTATDAKFDLAALQLMMGSDVKEQQNDAVWVLNEYSEAVSDTNGLVTVASVAPKYAATMVDIPALSVRLKDSNKLLKNVAFVADTEPNTDEFMFDTTNKKIILNSAHTGKGIVFNYKRSEVVDLVDILVDEVPFPVHIVHHGSFLQKDGTYMGIETELFSCRAKGNFTIDAARATASASTVSLTVLDPERPDGKLGTIKLFNTNTKA